VRKRRVGGGAGIIHRRPWHPTRLRCELHVHRGRVSYEPNSLGGGCPFQAGAAGFVSFPEPREDGDHKVRGKAERFADHYTQATLFWNSQTDVEKQHIINAFRFELSRVQTAAVRERMVSGLSAKTGRR
jgi:catalase